MELASMLAGEPFTDHPQSVCPVIAALLRAYNDWADDERRQELYMCAAKVVGSRGSTRLERARAEQVISWVSSPPAGRIRRLLWPDYHAMVPWPPYEPLGARTVQVLAKQDDRGPRKLLAWLDELLEMGSRGMPRQATARSAHRESAPSPRSPAQTLP
jgi:hypothetical protein